MIPIQLHCHTDYSRGDSIITIPQLVDYAKTNAMPAIAITEHGTLASSYKFWKECNNKGVKPILGCELYYAEDMARQDKEYAHIVLLAKNKEGWDNLKKISQIAYTDGFYYKPRTDFITIRKHRKGLICLTACCGGMLGHYVNLKDVPQESAYALAEANYLMLRDMFGEDLFIEFQLLRLGLARRMGEYIFNDLKTKYKDISCVVTNDIHYLNKKDFDLLNTFHAIKFKKKVSETDSSGYAECFPMNFEQLNIIRQEEYPFITEGNLVSAIEQTYAIEKRIENYSLEIGKGFVVVPQIKSDAMQYLKDKCDKGLKKIKKEDDDVYRQRLKRELGLVEQLGFADYFIVVKDLIKFCKLNEIKTGPNRGSVGGSLIAYLIGITAIDPIHFNLLFERFLNPNRVNLPDIDIDFDIQKRGTVIQYLKNKYKHVSNIISVGKFTVKTAFKGVGTALGLSFKTLNAVTQGLTLVSDDVDENMRELEMLAKEIIPDIESKYPNLFPYTKRLINMANFFGIHAAGLLIVPNTLTNWVPIRSAHGINEEADAGGLVSEYDMYDCDELGLLKLDILGLKNLTVIHNALKLIRQRHNKKININKLPLDDEKVYKLFNDGNVSGVFQFEASESMRSLIMRMCPKEFNDLSIAVALHRTPILMAQMHEEYLSRRNNFKAYDLHEDIREILKDTYGIILFQEQILEIVHKVGGLSFDEAEELRKGVAKKKKGLVSKYGKQFVTGAVDNGLDRKEAKKIWSLINKFSGYGFVRAHACGYAMIAYQTAWLKTYYPIEFMAALLNSENNNAKIREYIHECYNYGIEILKPDINRSTTEFVIEKNAIRMGLTNIKGLGESALQEILDIKKLHKIRDIEDIIKYSSNKKLNLRVMRNLTFAGVFDILYPDGTRYDIFKEYCKIAKKKKTLFVCRTCGALCQTSRQCTCSNANIREIELTRKNCPSNSVCDYSLLGISHMSLEKIKKIRRKYNAVLVDDLDTSSYMMAVGFVSAVKKIKDKRGMDMAFVTFSGFKRQISLTFFSDAYSYFGRYLSEGRWLIIGGAKDKKRENTYVINSQSFVRKIN